MKFSNNGNSTSSIREEKCWSNREPWQKKAEHWQMATQQQQKPVDFKK